MSSLTKTRLLRRSDGSALCLPWDMTRDSRGTSMGTPRCNLVIHFVLLPTCRSGRAPIISHTNPDTLLFADPPRISPLSILPRRLPFVVTLRERGLKATLIESLRITNTKLQYWKRKRLNCINSRLHHVLLFAQERG